VTALSVDISNVGLSDGVVIDLDDLIKRLFVQRPEDDDVVDPV